MGKVAQNNGKGRAVTKCSNKFTKKGKISQGIYPNDKFAFDRMRVSHLDNDTLAPFI